MNYELAKQLKDAGFPQLERADEAPRERNFVQKLGGKGRLEIVFEPTLSELIEACGEKILTLRNDYKSVKMPHWVASSGPYYKVRGDTPLEVVARLWLAINKKA